MDYSSVLSNQAKMLKPSGIRRFFDLASGRSDVISLGVGEPDFDTPWIVRQAGIESLKRGETWYTANAGLLKLRQVISKYLTRFDLRYNEKEILVTVGGSEALDLSIRALINPGDEVLIPEPSFVCYKPLVTLVGGVAIPIETKAEDDFRVNPQAVEAAITDKTKLMIFPFPNNPTGGVMGKEHLGQIADILKKYDLMVITDEIYAELTFDAKHHSLAAEPGMRERAIVVNGFSKAYAMTGWRMGYLAAPEELLKTIMIIHQYGIMSAPTTSQQASIVAIEECDDEIEKMRNEYNYRRRYIVSRLNEMGLECFMPGGAFYAFPSIKGTGLTSLEFCERLLEEKNVAVVPGDAFGDSGEGFVRISYSYSIEHIKIALERIEEFIAELK